MIGDWDSILFQKPWIIGISPSCIDMATHLDSPPRPWGACRRAPSRGRPPFWRWLEDLPRRSSGISWRFLGKQISMKIWMENTIFGHFDEKLMKRWWQDMFFMNIWYEDTKKICQQWVTSWHFSNWLVFSTPLKNMSSSVGIMKFPTEWKNKIHVPNHESDT